MASDKLHPKLNRSPVKSHEGRRNSQRVFLTTKSKTMMKIIDSLYMPGTKSELNLFDVPPTQVVVENC